MNTEIYLWWWNVVCGFFLKYFWKIFMIYLIYWNIFVCITDLWIGHVKMSKGLRWIKNFVNPKLSCIILQKSGRIQLKLRPNWDLDRPYLVKILTSAHIWENQTSSLINSTFGHEIQWTIKFQPDFCLSSCLRHDLNYLQLVMTLAYIILM